MNTPRWTLVWYALLIAAAAEVMSLFPDPSPCLAYIEGYKAAYNDYEKNCAPLHTLAGWGLEYARDTIKAHHESIVAAATVLIALFTVTLWRSTDKMWASGEAQRKSNERLARTQALQARSNATRQNRETRSALAIARKSADAAMLSARAAIAIQLPIIRATPSSLGYGQSRDPDGSEREYCSVHFVDYSNLGPTKAFPIEIRCGWTVGSVLPGHADYREAIYFDDPHFILEPAPAEPMRAFLRFNIPLNPDEWSLICEGKLKVWFYCTFVYEDFMRTRHDAGFCWCWKYVGMGNAWRVDDAPAYNRHT